MIIGRYSSYITNGTGSAYCKQIGDKRYSYTLQGKVGYGSNCSAAFSNWQTVSKKPSSGGGGLSTNSVAKAQGKINASGGVYNNPTGTSAPANATVSNVDKKLNASGSASIGLGAGANGAVDYIKDTAENITSAILPDSIEDKIPEGFPLWLLPIGAIGILTLILIVRR